MSVWILGWGSLLWDPEILTPHISPPWLMAGGPRLPMEFSRISPKRKMSLVVVLDPVDGVDCPTHAVASTRTTVAEAAVDLAKRERAPMEGIGMVCRVTGARRSTAGPIEEAVLRWCEAKGADGAVWTDLHRNFEAEQGRPFTLDRGYDYLRSLGGASLEEAVRYINSAPPQTDTPLRRRLMADPWWRSLS